MNTSLWQSWRSLMTHKQFLSLVDGGVFFFVLRPLTPILLQQKIVIQMGGVGGVQDIEPNLDRLKHQTLVKTLMSRLKPCSIVVVEIAILDDNWPGRLEGLHKGGANSNYMLI